MRKIILALTTQLVLISFSSCDKEDSIPPGWFTIDGQEKLLLANGYVQKVNEIEKFYRWDIYLASKGIDYDGNRTIKGKGDDIHFIVLAYDNDSNELPEGYYLFNEFPYDGTKNAIPAGCFVGVDFNYDTRKGETYDYIDDGSVTISKNGKNHILTFNFNMKTGQVVEGMFTGQLKPANW